MEEVAAGRAGGRGSFQSELHTTAQPVVVFGERRPGRYGLGIARRQPLTFDTEERRQLVEVGAGGLCQHDTAGGVVDPLAQDELAVGGDFQQLVSRIGFHQGGKGGIA